MYTVPVASLPGGRGDGQPVTTLIDLESGTHVQHFFAGPAGASLLLANTGGYGFIATVENMMSRQRAGKAFIDVGEGEGLCRPSLVGGAGGYKVSVRAPLEKPFGAEVLCLRFETGGGRQAAAGINRLPEAELARFTAEFNRAFPG